LLLAGFLQEVETLDGASFQLFGARDVAFDYGKSGPSTELANGLNVRLATERMITAVPFRLTAGGKGLGRAREVLDSERNAEAFADALRALVAEPCTVSQGN